MKRYILIITGILTILAVFLLPFGITIDLAPQAPNLLVSMIWEVPLPPPPTSWSIRFFVALIYYWDFIFFRLVFVIYVLRLMVGKYSKKQFLIIGIISEIVPIILSIPRFFIRNSQGEGLFVIIYPIPSLIIFDLILVLLQNRVKFNNVNN